MRKVLPVYTSKKKKYLLENEIVFNPSISKGTVHSIYPPFVNDSHFPESHACALQSALIPRKH